jgi:hypothetical protein
MQAELQGWHVVAGHGHCKSIQGRLQLMPEIGSEEKAGDWLSPVYPVSAAIKSAARLRRPADSDLSDIPAIGCCHAHGT